MNNQDFNNWENSMTPEQRQQIEACKTRAKTLGLSGLEGASLRFVLHREGWPEGAINEAMGEG